MRRMLSALFLATAPWLTSGIAVHAGEALPFRDPALPIEQRLDDAIARLSLAEKAAVLNHVGSRVQSLDLRADQWNQCLHGIMWDRPATLFPVCIAMAATWNPDLVHRVATALSDEARGIYNGWHRDPNAPGQHKGLIYRAPVINIGRNPYWGRNHEAWGEDPFLVGRMAVAYVRGLNGDDQRHLKIAATLKHFAVNNVEAGRKKLDVKVSQAMLRDYWLPHWRDAVVEGGAQSLMASYNAINGVPNNMNQWLLTDLLKDEWHHEGFVVSDLGGVKTMVEGHSGGTMDYVDAVARSIGAGCDFSDVEYEKYIPAAVETGKLSPARLDDAVRRVLRVRMRLGEFDPFESVSWSRISPDVVHCQKHRDLAREVARQAIVLLENRSAAQDAPPLLPLDAATVRTIAVIGPLADVVQTTNYFQIPGKPVPEAERFSPLAGIRGRLPGARVIHERGCGVKPPPTKDKDGKPLEVQDEGPGIAAAAEAAKAADVAIVVVGTNDKVEHEGFDRRTLALTGRQEDLVKAVVAANPRTVVVLASAGPLAVPWLAEHVPALLQAWWSGGDGGTALAEVLFGDASPAGRLPHTVYASDAQVPPQDEYDISKGFTYMYVNGEPLYPFGHGLSYSQFAYADLEASGAPLTVTATITNTGKRAGDEVVQLYLVPPPAATPRPRLMLRGFERIHLEPGASKRVTFSVPDEKLGFWNGDAKAFEVPRGAWGVKLGASSADIRLHTRVDTRDQTGQRGTQRPFGVRIVVDAAGDLGPLPDVWRFFGADEPNYATMPHGQKLLGELGELRPKQVYFRAHNLLTTGDGTPALKWGSTNAYTEDADGRPVYDWTILDAIFDSYLARGVRPYAQIGFMPKALSVKPEPYGHDFSKEQTGNKFHNGDGWAHPPKDFSKWEKLVEAWARHCVDRYGADEVASWYWETWNEPNIQYWKGTHEEFFRLHDHAIAAVRRVLPAAKVGGPDTAGDGGKFMDAFLDHCLHGTNFATGARGTPLDFVAFHAKGKPETVDGHTRMGIRNHLAGVEAGFRRIARHPELRRTPIVIGESDPEGCAACQGPHLDYRNGTMYSSYTAASFPRKLALAERVGVNLEGVLTWAFEFEGTPWFAGFRTLATNGIDKPVLNVFRMWSRMAGRRLPVESDAEVPLDGLLAGGVRGRPDVSAIASRDGDSLWVMVWHYHDDDVPGPAAEVALEIPGWKGDPVQPVHYSIDDDHSNAFARWKGMGSPQEPTADQVAELDRRDGLEEAEPPVVRREDDSLVLTFPLPRAGVSLFEWRPKAR